MLEMSELQGALSLSSKVSGRGDSRSAGGMDFARMLQQVQEDRDGFDQAAKSAMQSEEESSIASAKVIERRQSQEADKKVEAEETEGGESALEEKADDAEVQPHLAAALQEGIAQIVVDGEEAVEEEQAVDMPTARWQVAPSAQQSAGKETEAESEAADQAGADELFNALAEAGSVENEALPAIEEGPNSLDLLSFNEMMDPDLVVDQSPDQILTRIQQAAASNSLPILDEVADAVMPQIVRGLATLVRDGMAEMRLQLQPGDLGEIEMRVRTMDGVVRGQMMVQHPEIKQLLESQVERLRDALEQQGLALEGFDVDVQRDDRFTQSQEASNRSRNENRQSTETAEEHISQPSGPQHLHAGDGDVHYLV